MKTLAAILVETGQPLELADIEVPALRSGQVLVKVQFSGVCHTQLLEAKGHRGEDRFLPHCLGHEGSGIVLETGAGVTKVKAGDRVILSWMRGSGANVSGSVYRWDNRQVNAGGVTTFQQHSVVSENRLVHLPAPIGEADGALLGCAVPTGFGAVWNAGQARNGQRVAVFGIGGIGCSALAAARAREASPLVAVDIHPSRLQLAKQFGASETVHAQTSDPVESIRKLCPGGVDLAIEATGKTSVMQQALATVRPRGGTLVVVGNAKHGEQLQINPQELNQGKRIIGTWGGDNDPDQDFPRYCDLLIENQLDLSPLIPKVYRLPDVNTALDDLEKGAVPRPLIQLSS